MREHVPSPESSFPSLVAFEAAEALR
jgi:hypothetical protein